MGILKAVHRDIAFVPQKFALAWCWYFDVCRILRRGLKLTPDKCQSCKGIVEAHGVLKLCLSHDSAGEVGAKLCYFLISRDVFEGFRVVPLSRS